MNSSTTDLPIAHIVQDHCVVWDYTHASELFELEFFGKPVGIRKPNDFDFKRPLQLSLFDTAYLLEFNIIKVINHSRPFDLMARATLKRSPVCVPVRNISVIAVNNKVANQIVLLVWE